MANEVGCKEGEGAGSQRKEVRASQAGTVRAGTGRQEQVEWTKSYEGTLCADVE